MYGFVNNESVNAVDALGQSMADYFVEQVSNLISSGAQITKTLRDDALRKLKGLCNNKKCLGECGCTKDACEKEAEQITDKLITTFGAMANHPDGWGAKIGNNNIETVHCGWMCFHWQAIMHQAMKDLNLKCFKLYVGSDVDYGLPGFPLAMRIHHSWVNIALFGYGMEDEMANSPAQVREWGNLFKVRTASDDCVLRLDPWRDFLPKLFTSKEHGFKETFVARDLNGPETVRGYRMNDLPSLETINQEERWLPVLPQAR